MAEDKTTNATPATQPDEEVPLSDAEWRKNIEEVLTELIDKVEKLTADVDKKLKDAGVKPKGLFGGKREKTPTKDLKTGIVYPSKAAVGKALASEASADPLDSMAYYKVVSALKMPDGTERFVNASAEEGAAAIAKQKDDQEADVARRNAELDAEQAAKDVAAAAASKPAAAQAQPKTKGK